MDYFLLVLRQPTIYTNCNYIRLSPDLCLARLFVRETFREGKDAFRFGVVTLLFLYSKNVQPETPKHEVFALPDCLLAAE